MHSTLMLARASWLSAVSYRVRMLFSLASLLATVVPVYFVARALQPLMGPSIAGQGGQYFAFVIVGMLAFSFLSLSVTALPGAVGSGISSGTLEAMLATPVPVPALLAGLVGYGYAWATLKGALLLTLGWAMGMQIEWGRIAPALLILVLIVLAHAPFGLVAAALVLAFRTPGPLPQAVLVTSGLLGGVYYPTHVIPGWLQSVSAFLPLSYGLRALRRTLLEGLPLSAVAADLAILTGFVLALSALGAIAFAQALRYSRRTGTLAHY